MSLELFFVSPRKYVAHQCTNTDIKQSEKYEHTRPLNSKVISGIDAY